MDDPECRHKALCYLSELVRCPKACDVICDAGFWKEALLPLIGYACDDPVDNKIRLLAVEVYEALLLHSVKDKNFKTIWETIRERCTIYNIFSKSVYFGLAIGKAYAVQHSVPIVGNTIDWVLAIVLVAMYVVFTYSGTIAPPTITSP